MFIQHIDTSSLSDLIVPCNMPALVEKVQNPCNRIHLLVDYLMFIYFFFLCLCSDRPSHTAAVIAAIILLLFLGVAAVVYSRWHLNIKLWYKNSYGDYELNGETEVTYYKWLQKCVRMEQ